MKQFSILLLTLVFTISFAQNQMIEVEYENTFSFEIDEDELNVSGTNISGKEIAKQLKESMQKPTYYKLKTNNTESNWEYVPKIDNSQHDGNIRISFSHGGSGFLYKNVKEQNYTQSKDEFGNKIRIVDSLETFDWKISREKKEILGYEVRKATIKKDSSEIIAWYAPKLNYNSGPEKFWGLPGLILELTEKRNTKRKSAMTYKAIAIKPIEGKKAKIDIPKKGKIMNEEEYEEEQKKQMKKLQEMYGGEGNAVIIAE